MSARFEVVRSDGRQNWHVRFRANGRIVMSSEQYARKVGATRAIEAMGRGFSPVGMAHLDGEWLHVWLDGRGSDGEKLAIPVRYVDERMPEVKPRPRYRPPFVDYGTDSSSDFGNPE